VKKSVLCESSMHTVSLELLQTFKYGKSLLREAPFKSLRASLFQRE